MRRRKTAIFFIVLGICLSTIAVALNIGWIILNLREVALLIFGVVFFAIIITGLILNTIFLVREIRRNERHDAFLNAVTHELKTPIASIRLYLETLKSRDVEPEKQQEFYDVMLADSDRLLGTVEQVLQASRTREKGRELHLSEVAIGELLRETVDIVLRRHHLAETAIRFPPPAADVTITADRSELQTAFANLLENAVKYSPDGARISIKLRSTPRGAEIYIRDNGIGMARGDLKRVFKRFYRVQAADGVGPKGTGLGLAIVRSIIEKHGGRVSAESKGPGTGSTFIVTLPKI